MRLDKKGMLALSLGSLAFTALTAYRRRRAGSFSFRDRVVLITGGSRGLGLVMARQLVGEGARVAIVARDGAELERAAKDLRERGGIVLTIQGDVGERGVAEEAVKKIVKQLGRLDVLIHNAGLIQTGPYQHMDIADFEDAMATHFYGALYSTLAALPHLRKQPGARIVNIASIGGKIAVPHLLPYSASKFALVGFSSGLRAELARERIAVTTVCPGLMRTGSHVHALFKGKRSEEYFWFALSDSLPVITVSANDAAKQILAACRRGDAELVIGAPYRIATRLAALFPELVAAGLGLACRLMPEPTGAEGNRPQPGWASRSLTPSLLTFLSDREARRNNELSS